LICNGLKILSAGVSDRYRSVEELVEGDEVVQIRQEAQLLGKLSEKLIPSLFKLVETLTVTHRSEEMTDGDEIKVDKVDDASRVRAVTEAIASLAQVASKELVQSLFSKVLKRLLEASQAEDDLSEKMCSLLTLSQALVISESLDHSSISLLYRSLKPLIRTDETKPRIQKRAYKVLAEICDRCGDFVRESKQLNELLEVLTSSMATSQISSRFMRIKCLTMIVKSLEDPSEKEKVRAMRASSHVNECQNLMSQFLL
jgi:ribosomal RNA-processing protein 12